MGKDVIIACDFNSKAEVIAFLEKFKDEKPFVKIGMELFYAEGPDIVRTIKGMGHKIFLDLKLHDIPNTVKKAMAVLSGLDVDMCNVHAAGTKGMMQAALEGLTRADGSRPLLIAVTQLTSTSEEVMQQELWIDKPIDETVMHYAKNTMEAGLDGVVCSPLEAGKVHAVCGEKFLTITPGVRFADGDVGDQKRVTTPAKAKELGSHRSRKTDHTGGGSGSGIPQMCGRICRLGRHTRRGDGRNSLVSSFFHRKKRTVGKMPQKGLSGSTLKLIAIITMLIDHIGAAVIARLLIAGQGSEMLYKIYYAMRAVGRVAFPIFCFLLVEGFFYTGSRKKYALRLFGFALLSEIPFDLAFSGKILEFGYQNVFFTLLIGLLTIMLFDAVVKKQEWHPVLRSALLVIITFGGMGAAYLLHTDYDAKGVLAILVFYMTRQMRGLQIVAGCLAFCWELPAIVAFIPIAFYNGKRGWNIKYLFYAFYPVHLLVLYLICVGMGTAQIAVV